jgi:hypothetical protein
MKRIALVIAMVSVAACESSTLPLDSEGTVTLKLVNGVPGSGVGGIALLVDGQSVASTEYGQSTVARITPGPHTIEVRRVVNGGPGSAFPITVADGDERLIVAVQPALGGPEPLIYGDTNAVVPANATKLRVIHAAALAPAVTVRRTQPDFDSLITVMFPFLYQDASPYLQSTVGTWSVVVSRENQNDTLGMTGPVAIPAGRSRTVVILDDGAGGVTLRVVDP